MLDYLLEWSKQQVQNFIHKMQENKNALIQELRENKTAEMTARVFSIGLLIGVPMYPIYLSVVLKQMKGALNNPSIGFHLAGVGRSVQGSWIKNALTTQEENLAEVQENIKEFYNIQINDDHETIIPIIDKLFFTMFIAVIEAALTQRNFIKKLVAIIENAIPTSNRPTFWNSFKIGIGARCSRNFFVTAGLMGMESVSKNLPDNTPSIVGPMVSAVALSGPSTFFDNIARIKLGTVTQSAPSGPTIKAPSIKQIVQQVGIKTLLTGNQRNTAATLLAYSIYQKTNERFDRLVADPPQTKVAEADIISNPVSSISPSR